MPTYEYQCEICGHRFDKVQKISDVAVVDCPECGGATERLISGGAGLLFKGSGFYLTDYRSESYKKAAEKEKNSSKPSSEAKSSKSEDKKGAKKNGE